MLKNTKVLFGSYKLGFPAIILHVNQVTCSYVVLVVAENKATGMPHIGKSGFTNVSLNADDSIHT